MQLSSLY